MTWLSLIIASLFTWYVGLVRPLLGYNRYQAFLKEIAVVPAARSRYYWHNMVGKWLWLIVIGIILLLSVAPPSILGLQTPDSWEPTLWPLAEIVILLPIVQVIQLRALKKRQGIGLLQLILTVKELLPRTLHERFLWIFVSITAGICEEIVFRGFLPWYFLQLGTFFGLQVSYLAAVILSTILFGFVHLYQGWKGMLATGLVGALLAYLYAYTGSLILPIAIHILIDARLVFLAPAILKLDQQNKNV